MRFMMMYRPDANMETAPPPKPEQMAAMGGFVEEMIKSGVLLATDGLQPMSKGARVRRGQGKVTVTDGPFVEAKELIGGYAVVQAASKDEAIEIAKRFLAVAGDGETEIRQIFEASDFPPCLVSPEDIAREQALREEMQRRAAVR